MRLNDEYFHECYTLVADHDFYFKRFTSAIYDKHIKFTFVFGNWRLVPRVLLQTLTLVADACTLVSI